MFHELKPIALVLGIACGVGGVGSARNACAEEREDVPTSADSTPRLCNRAADGSVVCPAPAFKSLVSKCTGYRTDRDLCRVDLETSETKRKSTQASLDLCLTPVPPMGSGTGSGVGTSPAHTSRAPAPFPFVLGALGAGLLMSTVVFATAPTDTKVIMGSAGVVALGTGLWLSF